MKPTKKEIDFLRNKIKIVIDGVFIDGKFKKYTSDCIGNAVFIYQNKIFYPQYF